MATAQLLIADHRAFGVTLGVTYDTTTLALTEAWSTNTSGASLDVNIAVGPNGVTLTLPPGTLSHALPGGLRLVRQTIAPGITPTLALPINVETRVPA
jgi:hypothetical protein